MFENSESQNNSTMPKPDRPVKKIKLVISDLHLGKGKFLPNGGINSLEEFQYGEKLVEFINYWAIGPHECNRLPYQ